MNTKFSEYRPSLPLQTLVHTYWTGDFNLYSENQFVQSVVPNGCIELIIHLSNNHCELVKDGNWGKTPEFMVIGLQMSAYPVRFEKKVEVFGIRFYPDGIYSTFGIPPSQFTGSFEDVRELSGPDFNEYCNRLRETGSLEAKIRLTENFLLKAMAKRSSQGDYLSLAPQLIRRHQGLTDLDRLLGQIPISRRQLQREFKNKYGITAKEYMRLSRMNAIQRYMQSGEINLSSLTYETGFADQSHFIREFKLLTGANPKKFVSKRENYIVNI